MRLGASTPNNLKLLTREQSDDLLVRLNDLLPENQARALWLKQALGLTGDEVASELGVSRMTVYRWIKQAEQAIGQEFPELIRRAA